MNPFRIIVVILRIFFLVIAFHIFTRNLYITSIELYYKEIPIIITIGWLSIINYILKPTNMEKPKTPMVVYLLMAIALMMILIDIINALKHKHL